MPVLPCLPRFAPAAAARAGAALACWLVLGLAAPALAERADRLAPMNIESDSLRYDEARKTSVFTGNVVVTKGSIVLQAERIEVRQEADGHQVGVATAAPGKVATFRQKREGVDETIAGEGERIEYDSRADVVRFVSRAVLRRYRGQVLSDETRGTIITYNNTSEVFTVEGGRPDGATPSTSSGRVRATISPREGPALPGAPGVPPAGERAPALRPSGSLGPGQ